MTTLRRFFVLFVVSISCALFATGCEDIISDPNFHTWCGDQLCSWKLESGEIRKSPTWHKKDFGVELLDGTGPNRTTALSQVVGKTPTCLEFAVIADVAIEAQVSVSVDFGADGTIEYEQPIAALGFREQKTQITAPLRYSGIKFTITKRGVGRAVLAQMDVRSKTDCSAPPVALKPQAIGTACSLFKNDDGGWAFDDAACQSGVCCEGVCAECCVSQSPPRDGDGGLAPDPENTCSDGAKCEALELKSATRFPFNVVVPRQCDPGVRKRDAGKECLLAEDCASGFCDGAEWTLVNNAVDGGACAPPPVQDPDCVVSSVHAGRCR